MRILVTGSAGHLGEALMRTLRDRSHEPIGVDILPSPFTSHAGSIADRSFVKRCMSGMDAVLHTATLHKPHVSTHERQNFVDTNITGTLNLLEEAAAAKVESFVFTSTTSAFGSALNPPPGMPAAWITEEVASVPKNIYGATKTAAEDLCHLFHKSAGIPCIVLRTSRFFLEDDDDKDIRTCFAPDNAKANEFLHRRVDLEDAVAAHLLAIEHAHEIGFGRYIISATTPFLPEDIAELAVDAPAVVRRRVPAYEREYARRGWRMFPRINRVYVNEKARRDLAWEPRYNFADIIGALSENRDFVSPLARLVGSKGYHAKMPGTAYPYTKG